MKRPPLFISTSLVFATFFVVTACGTASPQPPVVPDGFGEVQTVSPSRALRIRAAFDADPSVYAGHFFPAGLDASSPNLDESEASNTKCSKYFSTKIVKADQEMDEYLIASSTIAGGISGSHGTAAGAASASKSSGTVYRVHYKITEKMQVVSDAEKLSTCCRENSGACTKLAVGEFVRGTGEMYALAVTDAHAQAELSIPVAAASVSYSDATKWKKVKSFNDTYFAFRPTVTGEVQDVTGGTDCGFCMNLPTDDSGLYFCGVSAPAVNESDARNSAMLDARKQVVDHLGQEIVTETKQSSSLTKGLLSGTTFTTALANGLVSEVKGQKFCIEKQNSPDHLQVVKVQAYVSRTAVDHAAVLAAEKALEEKKKTEKVSAADEAATKAAVGKAAKK
jgi:hypothetical protein